MPLNETTHHYLQGEIMDEQPTKWQKFKEWCTENADIIGVVTLFGTVSAAVGTLVYVDSKDQKKRIEAYNAYAKEHNNWLNDTQNAGNRVYALNDGRYLVVPTDSPQELVIK